MSPEKELAIGRGVGDGEVKNLRTYNSFFLNSFIFLITLLLTVVFQDAFTPSPNKCHLEKTQLSVSD